MQENSEKIKPVIVIIGAGAAGFSAAIELAEKGYPIELFEKKTLGSGASGRNPGRMGHGFHYTDEETAKSYLRASVLVQKTYPGYLIGEDQPPNSALRHGRYFITKNSDPTKDIILATYEAIKNEYKRLIDFDPTNEVFGPPDQFYRILEPSEYRNDVNMDIVDVGIETSECLFNWQAFMSAIKKIIINHPNITLREETEVINISRNELGKPRFIIEAKSAFEGETFSINTDYIINSTWQDIKRLNDHIGLKMVPGERTNRLKTILILKLPKSLEHSNSMFFCMGQHCMYSNLGGGLAMATYARVTNLESSSALSLSPNAERLLNGGATIEEKVVISQQMLAGISQYIPEMANANILDLKFGIIQTKGELSLSDLTDPTHSFHKRDDHCVNTEQIGFISNPCMKLFYFIDNSKIVADLIEQHQRASTIIQECMFLIQEKAIKYGIKFNAVIQRTVLENLERYESSKLTIDNIDKIVNTLFTTICVKRTTRFWFANNSDSNNNDDDPGLPNNLKK